MVAGAIALACAAPGAALARVDIATNEQSDQVVLHQILGQANRPLFASVRPAGGGFTPLARIGEPTQFLDRALVVDDAGGAAVAWSEGNPAYYLPPGRIFASSVDPSGTPADSQQLDDNSIELALAGNRRGDAIATWNHPDGGSRYSLRTSGSAFGEAQDSPLDHLVGAVLDEDGTAVLVGSDGAGGLLAVTRSPDGSVGRPTQIQGPTDRDEAHLATATNGRALLVWSDRTTVHANERPPRGDFGPPFDVGPAPEDLGADVAGVQVASNGAAVVVRGDHGDLVSARDPGGPFSNETTIPHARYETTSPAVAASGEAVVAWHGRAGAVRARYRRAGQPGWSEPTTLAPAPAFTPAVQSPPSVAVGGAGKATVAWEQSDGEHVRVYARTLHGTTLGRRVLVGSKRTYFAENDPAACRPPGAAVFRATRRVTVFANDHHELTGCLLARGVPVPLWPIDPTYPPRRVAIAGALVAWGYSYSDRLDEGSLLHVTDLRDEQYGINREAWVEGDDIYATIAAIRLRRNGAVAWISCTDPTGMGAERRFCLRVGSATKHVWLWRTRREDPRRVDAGRRIDPRSFRLDGDRLTWRKGGKLHHATLG